MPSADHARLALLALTAGLALIAAPSLAQTANQQAPTTASMAPIAAATIATEWLGEQPKREIAGRIDQPLWQGRGAMHAERQLAEQVIRAWWPANLPDAKADAILNGFATYLQTRALERVFDVAYLRTAHSFESQPYFGGRVMWSFPPLRLSRHAAVKGDRYAAVFDSLERWLGTPALQAAMFEVAQLPADRLTAASIVKTISDAAGQDLTWAFEAAETEVNYSVDAISGTSVTISRQGTGMVTGRAAPRIGGFDSGDAQQLRVAFANGDAAFASWDGRDQTRTFTFSGTSPIVAAYLDPDHIVTADVNRLDNAIVPPAATNVPVGKWVARWMVWLQHTMLSYGFLA